MLPMSSSCECGSKAPLATAQELSEMDFERSACGAAVAGDYNRLQTLLRTKAAAAAGEKTAAGLTPLVCGLGEKKRGEREKEREYIKFTPISLSLSLSPFAALRRTCGQ